jgi:hypothetical protein
VTLSELCSILDVLIAAFESGDSETTNVVATSIIEKLGAEPFYLRLQPSVGLALQREFKRQVRQS